MFKVTGDGTTAGTLVEMPFSISGAKAVTSSISTVSATGSFSSLPVLTLALAKNTLASMLADTCTSSSPVLYLSASHIVLVLCYYSESFNYILISNRVSEKSQTSMSKPVIEFRANKSDGTSIRSDIQSIVPLTRLQKLRYLYRQNPLVEHIRSVLTKSIWSGGVNLYKVSQEGGHFLGNETKIPWTPPPDVQHILDTVWSSFKVDVFDSLLMFGWVVVHFQQRKDETSDKIITIPHVVPCELYRMLISTTLEHGTTLHALHVREQCELPDTIVFHKFSYDPSPLGMMNSLVAKAAAELSYLSDHATTAMTIRQLRCRPTVVIEKGVTTKNDQSGNAEAQRRALLDGIHSDTIGHEAADRPSATNVTTGHIAVPEGVNLAEDLEVGQRAYNKARQRAALRRGDVDEAVRLSMIDWEGQGVRPMGACTGIALKSGEQAKFAPTLSESNDFETTRRSLVETIGGVFGVPISVLSGNGRSGGVNSGVGAEHTKTVHAMFRLGVQEWRGKLSSILTDCFTECYFDLLVKEVRGDDQNVDAYKEKKYRTVHIDFAPSTFVGNAPLRECYEWGIIDFETFGQYCLSNLGLPTDVQVKVPPKDCALGVGLPDPNADVKLKEAELELKREELKFKEQEAKMAHKREEAATKIQQAQLKAQQQAQQQAQQPTTTGSQPEKQPQEPKKKTVLKRKAKKSSKTTEKRQKT